MLARLVVGGLILASPLVAQRTVTVGNPGSSRSPNGPYQGTCEPFGCWQSDEMSGYQTLYHSSLFGSRPINIFQLDFFRDFSYRYRPGQEYEVGSLLGAALITFSTTPVRPSGISPTLATNFGFNTQTFFAQFLPDRGNVGFTPGNGVFYGQIVGAPYRYDPRQGNLLIDIVLGPGTTHVDYETNTDPRCSVANSYQPLNFPGSPPEPPSSGVLLGYCMNTRFTYSTVPEPSSWALLLTGLIGFGLLAKARSGVPRRPPS